MGGVRRSHDEIQRILAELETSDLTITECARRHNISRATLYTWQRREREELSDVPSGVMLTPPQFVEVAHADSGSGCDGFDCELHLSAMSLRFPAAIDGDHLAMIVTVLKKC